MGALARLGIRLTRAGGWLRIGSVVVGCALAVALLSIAWELPDAMFPPTGNEGDVHPQRGPISSLLALITAPVIALLLAVGRMSSEVRDRRLGSLVLLGVNRRRVLLVTIVENVLPALVGAVAGIAVFTLLRALLTAVAADVLVEPIGFGRRLVVVAVATVLLSALLAVAPVRRLSGVRSGSSEAVVLAPSLWRMTPVPVAVALLVAVFATPPEQVTARTGLALLGAAVAAALCVALVTPLLTAAMAGRLTRSRTVAPVLAGRLIQTQGAAISRRVTTLGVTTFVVLSGAGYLGLYESDPVTAAYVHQVEHGPQEIWLMSPDGQTPVDPQLLEELDRVDGVQGAWSRPGFWASQCADQTGQCPQLFVGTCQDLALVADVSGCSDAEAAWIEWISIPPALDDGWLATPSERDPHVELAISDTGRSVVVPVPGAITQDLAATTLRWPFPQRYDLFVPATVARQHGALEMIRYTVIADVGSEIRSQVTAAAESAGAHVFSPAVPDYQRIVTLRTAVWSVSAASIAVALLVFTLASVDRARTQRRGRARLVSVGVPGTVLRRAQGISNGIPLAVAVLLACGFGWASVAALAHTAGAQGSINWGLLATTSAVTAAAAALASLVTLPLTRAVIRAEDLRQE